MSTNDKNTARVINERECRDFIRLKDVNVGAAANRPTNCANFADLTQPSCPHCLPATIMLGCTGVTGNAETWFRNDGVAIDYPTMLNGGAILAGADTVVTLSGCILMGGEATGLGGALFAKSAAVFLSDTHFAGTRAISGGAVYVLRPSVPVEISGCSFTHSTATGIPWSVFSSPRPSQSHMVSGGGGAVAVMGHIATLRVCDLGAGGCRRMPDGYFKTEPPGHYKAIPLNQGRVVLSNTRFQHTTARYGGALALIKIAHLRVTGCTFHHTLIFPNALYGCLGTCPPNMEGLSQGGAPGYEGEMDTDITQRSQQYDQAEQGGAIYAGTQAHSWECLWTEQQSMLDTFQDFDAPSGGDCIFKKQSGVVSMIIQDSSFDSFRANFGGAINVHSWSTLGAGQKPGTACGTADAPGASCSLFNYVQSRERSGSESWAEQIGDPQTGTPWSDEC